MDMLSSNLFISFFILNNRRFGSQTLDRDSLALRPSEWVELATFGFKQESSN